MKNLVLGMSVAFAASQAAGCVISSDSSELGHVSATWHVDHVRADGSVSPTSCPNVGGIPIDTAALHTVAASSDGTAIASCESDTDVGDNCFIDLFTCDDNVGVSSPLPAQNYLTWVELTNHDGSLLYATSTSQFVDITDVDMNFDTEILVDGGYFQLRWSLQGEQSGAPLTCSETAAAQAAGGSVETTATLNGSTVALSDKFDCEDHFGYSDPLPWGQYDITVDALNSQDQALSSQAPIINNQTIASMPNDITDLGHVVIPIAGM
jgi:hypothetical protein